LDTGSCFGSAICVAVEEIFPFPFYFLRKIRKLRQAENTDILQREQYANYATIKKDELQERLREERLRASAMDEKTFKLTLSLSVGLTILGSTAALLIKNISLYETRVALVVLISLSLFYILSSGCIALGALKTLPSYGYGTSSLLVDAAQQQRHFAECLARAETVNIVRHLRNETAYQSLRNGLFLLFAAAAVFAIFLGQENLSTVERNDAPPSSLSSL
jgi:hypothetical protein